MQDNRIISERSARRLRSVLLTTSLVAAAIGGCSSGDERKRVAALAGGCSINSDCEKDLICAFERCHEACRDDYDCDADLRCVKSEETELFVCQLKDETQCDVDKDCPGDQQCGIDDECRDACKKVDDCIGDQSCDPSGKCASNAPGKDLLDSSGRLIAAGSVVIPGAGGAGGGSKPPGEEGGEPGVTNAGGTGPGEVDNAGGDEPSASAGSATEGGAPNDGYPPAEFEEKPGVAETVDNDFRENAIPITESVNIYLSKKTGAGLDYDQDADWFSFTAPDDGRAHIITVRMEQEATLHMSLKAYAEVDGTEIGTQLLEVGTLRYAYVTAGSGATTLFRFSNYLTAGSKGMAFITFSEVAENDDHEPNNDKTTATPIGLGDAVFGQVLNPFVSETDHPNQDWYRVELAVGSALLTLNSAPTDGRMELDILYPNQGQLTIWKRPDAGSTGAWSFNVTTAGTHYVVVQPSSLNSAGGIKSFDYLTPPDYLKTQYSITVTQ